MLVHMHKLCLRVNCSAGTVQRSLGHFMRCGQVGCVCCDARLGRSQLLHQPLQALYCAGGACEVLLLSHQAVGGGVNCLQSGGEWAVAGCGGKTAAASV